VRCWGGGIVHCPTIHSGGDGFWILGDTAAMAVESEKKGVDCARFWLRF